MNGAQLLLVLGAIVLFSFVSLTSHRTVLNATSRALDTEATITAAEIGETLLTEIKTKAFDENVIGKETTDVTKFTLYLGPGGSETLATYDDVDDYNNHTRVVSTPRLGSFTAAVSVRYVLENYPETVTTSRTHVKRVRVTVTGALLKKPVVLTYFASY